MKGKYLDMDNINHLISQSRGGGIHEDRNWRESYYFNMTDPKKRISIITTIGQLPNKKRSVGFILIIKDDRPIVLKPLISLKKPLFSGYEFRIGDMGYSVEGTDWRLKFNDKKIGMDLKFSPVNRIYPYRKDDEEEWIFERIGTQHYEQFGMYSGSLVLNGKEMRIGPCLGHRDHSWGIRDWASIDRYSLHCCAFSKDLAFNIWDGSISGKPFFKGFVFDGEENVDVIDQKIMVEYQTDGREPKGSHIVFRDSKNRRFEVNCESTISIPFPPSGSLVYEGIGKMTINNSVGFGLQEYLWHYPNKLKKLPFLLKLLKIGRGF